MGEDKVEDRGRTLPSGAPGKFSPKVETARVSDRDIKIDRGGRREGKKHIKRQTHKTNIDRETQTKTEMDRRERGVGRNRKIYIHMRYKQGKKDITKSISALNPRH